MANRKVNSVLERDIFSVKNEELATASQIDIIYPKTNLDQVIDSTDPTHKTLRQILDELRTSIKQMGVGKLVFPVTSVNNMRGDVHITSASLNLGRVDNTSDMDKPLSPLQKTSIMDILKNYRFDVNLDDMYAHMANTNNPHNVTLEQLNASGDFTDLIDKKIREHSWNESPSVHRDIRQSLARLWHYVDEIYKEDISKKIEYTNSNFEAHLVDPSAHKLLFDKKENVDHKVNALNKASADYTTYPTTRAVINYIDSIKDAIVETIPQIDHYIETVYVVDKESDLPIPTKANKNHAFIIRHGSANGGNAIAVSLELAPNVYKWKIESFGALPNFDKRYFITKDGTVTLDMAKVYAANDVVTTAMKDKLDKLLGNESEWNTTLDNTVREILARSYMLRSEIENRFVQSVQISPGTMNGYIGYSINNNPSTYKEFRLTGLQSLAFLEKVTEREIQEQAIEERHYRSDSIPSRAYQEASIQRRHLAFDLITTIFNDVLHTKHFKLDLDGKIGVDVGEVLKDLPDVKAAIKKAIDTLDINHILNYTFNPDYFIIDPNKSIRLNIEKISSTLREIDDLFGDIVPPGDLSDLLHIKFLNPTNFHLSGDGTLSLNQTILEKLDNLSNIGTTGINNLLKEYFVEDRNGNSTLNEDIIKKIALIVRDHMMNEQTGINANPELWHDKEPTRLGGNLYGWRFQGYITATKFTLSTITLSTAITSLDWDIVQMGGMLEMDQAYRLQVAVGSYHDWKKEYNETVRTYEKEFNSSIYLHNDGLRLLSHSDADRRKARYDVWVILRRTTKW